jgi:hypothetical protein
MTMAMTMTAQSALAQLGALVSPGQLHRAHRALEGVTHCLSCHSAGEQVSASKCLTCHAPVAERIARKTGIHRNVTTDCVTCHVEHAGADAELRPFDLRQFDHGRDASFPLDGEHARLAQNCASCHKTRSFLTLSSSCASCHSDVHKGTLGTQCAKCHTTAVKFAETRTRFDHSRTAFALTGAHQQTACGRCHTSTTYKNVKFASCADCHSDVHRARFGPACSSCHTTAAWRTTRVDHARTAFPLRGKHATVNCARCHTQPAMQVKPASATCSACHSDPHRGVFKQDCASCHNETAFQKGRFDHGSTKFPLVDKHANLTCVACHKGAPAPAPVARAARSVAVRTVDYRGLSTACHACHTDVHRGELGLTCDSCHTARSFAVATFTHQNHRAFFAGGHMALTCEQCHATTFAPVRAATKAAVARVGFATTPAACASCHKDVHLGQVGAQCETCHDVAAPRFALAGFSHARTEFALTGKHESLDCASCHKVEAAQFPAGHGQTRRLTGMGTACVACHADVHRTELPQACEQCHTTERFAITQYAHRNARTLRGFFTGAHAAASCAACHKPAAVIVATGTVLPSFRTSTTCTTCHTDVHRGALGNRCETCHRW